MTHISNYDRYTQLMRNGFYDKLFFVDKLFDDWGSLVDFGCADGAITREIKNIFPEKKIIGYDKDRTMITAAVMKNDGCEYYDKPVLAKGDVLYISSLIHEVYSYCSAEQIDEFWDYVFHSGFKYIVIRDMIYSEDIERESHVNEIRKVHAWCHANGHEKFLKEFERTIGKITSYKNLIHFLLKYSYTEGENWPREVKENYLPLSIETFYELIPNSYRIFHTENYTLPYFKHMWAKDFDLIIDEKIHSKYILKLV